MRLYILLVETLVVSSTAVFFGMVDEWTLDEYIVATVAALTFTLLAAWIVWNWHTFTIGVLADARLLGIEVKFRDIDAKPYWEGHGHMRVYLRFYGKKLFITDDRRDLRATPENLKALLEASAEKVSREEATTTQ